MNTENLRSLVDEILATEARLNIGVTLEQLRTELRQLASSPQDQNFQINYSKTLELLNTQMAEMIRSFTAARAHDIKQIGGDG